MKVGKSNNDKVATKSCFIAPKYSLRSIYNDCSILLSLFIIGLFKNYKS